MNATSGLQINLNRLERNLAAFRSLVQHDERFIDRQPMICAVVKANAYGLGAVPIAKRLIARGVDMLAVYSPAQAEELVKQAVNSPILLLMPLRALSRSDGLYRLAAAGMLHLSIHDVPQIEQINQFGQMLGLRMPVHLYFDTGMSRSGLGEQDMIDVLAALPEMPHVRLAGIYTHMATAGSDEEAADAQRERFEAFLEHHAQMIPQGVVIHMANTFAAMRDRRYHRDMIRVGLGVYGYGPELLRGGQIISDIEAIQPTVRWTSRVLHVARYPMGATVGYDATHVLRRESVLGLVPVGFGDGYPTALSNRGVTCLPQFRTGPDHPAAPVIGRVSMDQTIIDLTDIAKTIEQGKRRMDDDKALGMLVDSEVELVSDDPTSPCALPQLAEAAGTTCYELLCRIGAHVPRKYVAGDPSQGANPPSAMRMV